MSTNTIVIILLVCMLVMFMLKIPVYISMALTGCALMFVTSSMKWSILSQYLYTGVNSFTLLSIPLFLLAAKLMNTGSITKKLFAFCMKVVGWLPGGLGHVNVLCSVVFAGMSGTAVSDAGGLGSIEIKAMNENGFDNDFSCCVTAASSTLGPIIPPSIPLVVYATVSGASVGALFMAGIIPGVVMALLMMAVVTIYAIIRHYPRTKFPSGREFLHALKEGFLPLMAPVILLVGIYGGVFTPTESAAVVVCYSLFLEIVIYKELTFKKFIMVLKETVRDSITIALIIAGATFFGLCSHQSEDSADDPDWYDQHRKQQVHAAHHHQHLPADHRMLPRDGIGDHHRGSAHHAAPQGIPDQSHTVRYHHGAEPDDRSPDPTVRTGTLRYQ